MGLQEIGRNKPPRIGGDSKIGCVLDLPLYRKDGGAFMSDDVYGHLCTNHGAEWNMQGRVFNGTSDYIDCGNDVSLETATDLTVSFWINPVSFTGSGGNYSNSVRYGTDNYICSISNTGEMVWVGRAGGAFQIISDRYTLPNLNQWYHIVLVYNTTIGGQLYVDGDAKGSLKASGNLTIGGNLYLGGYGSVDKYFYGSIDNVRIYNRALSSDEAEQLARKIKERYI